MDTKQKINYLIAIASVFAGATAVSQAQLHEAGVLLVNIDATTNALGTLTSITNNGTLGGYFEAKGVVGERPSVAVANGNGTSGIRFDGNDFLQYVNTLGGPVVSADATLTGVNPDYSVEAWVLNPNIAQEETIVSWGHRGGPDGSNMSFNNGWDGAFGAMGHWGGADLGWDSGSGSGNPQGNPTSGVWHHLVYTFDGTTQRVYSDGVLKNSENVSLNIHTVPPITIAAQMDNDTVVTGGLRGSLGIAKLRVHSAALNASQVLSNYNMEVTGISNGGSPLPVGPIHRYSFSNPAGPAGTSNIVDSIGTAHGEVKGAGATFTGTRLTLPGGFSSTAAYVDLPNLLLSTNSADNGGSGKITFEGFVKNNGNQSWGRIFDFGNGTAGEVTGPGGVFEGRDYFFLSSVDGTNPQRHNTGLRNLIAPTGSDTGNGWDTANANRDYHFAVTWDESTGLILCYENGSLAAGYTVNSALDRFSTIQDVNVWLGRSNWDGDRNFQGEFDEFRIYNVVLPADQVRASYAAGANALATADPVSITAQPQSTSTPEFGDATFSVAIQGQPPLSLQWYKNGSPIAGQTGNLLNLTTVPLSDNGSTYLVIASNFISPNSYFATSQTATLTVLADTNPPIVLSARVNATNLVEVFFNETVNAADLVIAGNFVITGSNAPIVLSAAAGVNNRSAILTIDRALIGCEFYLVTVTGVHDVSAGANVVTPPNNTATIWNYSVTGLTHRYNFNQVAANATGVAAVDSVGGADGVVRNLSGVTVLNGSVVTLSGGAGDFAPYVDLPNNLLSANSTNNAGSGQVTLEGWVKVTGGRSWSRIFDFGATDIGGFIGGEVFGPGPGAQGIDYFFYSAQIGDNTAARRLDRSNRDGGDVGNAGVEYGISNFGQQFHFAVTWNEVTGQIQVFEDGALRGTMVSSQPMSSLNDVNVWLGRSVWTVDQNLQGEFDEFRVYNKVLSTSEISLNKAAGPDNSFGSLLSLNLIAGPSTTGTNTMITNSTANVSLLGVFSGIGTQELASAQCIVYSSSDSNIVYITPDGVIHSVNAGSTTVSATLGGITDTEVIEVTQDATPPSLVRARANGIRTIEIQFSEPVDLGTSEEPSSYVVSGPSGPLDVDTVTRQADQSRVVVALLQPMPCEYITVLVSFVADQSPLFNQIAENSPVSFFHYSPAGLQHRYTFNNAAGAGVSGTVVADTLGTGNGTLLGGSSTFTGDKVVLPGGSPATAAYVDLPNGLLSVNSTNNGGSGQISIEGWVRVTGNNAWSRIFDFGSSGPCCGTGGEIGGPGGGGEGIDYLFFSAEVGTDVNTRQLEIANRDQANHGAVVSAYPIANFNQTFHYMVTWDERTGQLRSYEDGVLRASPVTVAAMSEINDVNVWLGRSTWTQDSNMQGEFDDFRVYNRIVSLNELNLNRAVGPDNLFGQPQALRVTVPTNFMHSGQSQQINVEADFSSISNVNLTVQQCYTASLNTTVLSNSAAGVLYAVGSGTTDVVIAFSGFSTTNTVVVNASPVGGDDGLATPKNTAITVALATLLSNDNDPDGNLPLTTVVSATSTNGAIVTTTLTDVTYTPVGGYSGPDLFTYTITDTLGGSDVVNVSVFVTDGPLPPEGAIGITPATGGGYTVTFRGTPGSSCRIQRTTDLTAPVSWTDLSTQTVPLSGIISITDPAPPVPQAFYRVICP